MDICFAISKDEAGSSGLLQVCITGSRVELFGLASGRKIAFEGASGDVTVRLLPIEEAQQPTVEQKPVVEAVTEVRQEAVEEFREAVSQADSPDVAAEKPSLFQQLVTLRKQISAEVKLPPFIIFHDSTLKEMCSRLPADLQALKSIPGVGSSKLDKYGSRFLDIIRRYAGQGIERAA